MPYTKDELDNLPFYQELITKDESKYLNIIEKRTNEGILDDGILRDKSGKIILFEDPYQNQLQEDESSKIVYDLKVKKLKTDDSINQILSREFREL